jgi:hypothetical protein
MQYLRLSYPQPRQLRSYAVLEPNGPSFISGQPCQATDGAERPEGTLAQSAITQALLSATDSYGAALVERRSDPPGGRRSRSERL